MFQRAGNNKNCKVIKYLCTVQQILKDLQLRIILIIMIDVPGKSVKSFSPTHFLERSIFIFIFFLKPQTAGAEGTLPFFSVYHTQARRVKGQSISRRYSPGPSRQSNFFKLPTRTKAATGQQWPASDNKQIKRHAHKRFIASAQQRPPMELPMRTTRSGGRPSVNPLSLSRASPPPPKGSNHKNSNGIVG